MNLVLFINGNLGLRILKNLVETPDHEILAVILNSEEKRTVGYIEEVNRILNSENYLPKVLLWNGSDLLLEELDMLPEMPAYGISALFGHIFSHELISKFIGGILNLHPSLLPFGRGANPVSWSIIDRLPQGITLHLIDKTLDTGDIIFQKEIFTSLEMTAGEIYEITMAELLDAFSTYFPKWINGELSPYPQPTTVATFHKSSDLSDLRLIKENDFGSFGEFIRRIQASTFSDGRLPLFADRSGKVWEIEFKMTNPRNQD